MKRIIFLLIALFSLVAYSTEKQYNNDVKSEIVYSDVGTSDVLMNDFAVNITSPVYGIENPYFINGVENPLTIESTVYDWVLYSDVGFNSLDCNIKTNAKMHNSRYLKKNGTEVRCNMI